MSPTGPSQDDFLHAWECLLRWMGPHQPTGTPHISVSTHAMKQVQQSFALHLDTTGGTITPDRLPEVIAGLLRLAVAVPLLSMPALAGEYSVLLLRAWLRHTTYTFIAGPAYRRHIIRLLAEGEDQHGRAHELESVLQYCLVQRSTGRRLHSPPDDDVPQAFIASAMTLPTNTQLDDLVPLVRTIAWNLEDLGIFAFAPTLLDDPRISREQANRRELADRDELAVSQSDVVVLVMDPPAHGVSIVARLAVQFRPLVLQVVGTGCGVDTTPVVAWTTPLVRSTRNHLRTVTRNVSDAVTAADVAAVFKENRKRIHQRRLDRMHRFRAASAQVETFVDTLESMPATELASLPDLHAKITPRRLRFLLGNPALFADAIGEERDVLGVLVPQALPQLSAAEAAAAIDARLSLPDAKQWSEYEHSVLLEAGRRMKAREASSPLVRLRSALTTRQFWLDLAA